MPNILIVDDDRLVQKMMCQVLKHKGYDTMSASDRHAALDKISEATSDLILLDIKLPGIDGFEVTAKIKGSISHRKIQCPESITLVSPPVVINAFEGKIPIGLIDPPPIYYVGGYASNAGGQVKSQRAKSHHDRVEYIGLCQPAYIIMITS